MLSNKDNELLTQVCPGTPMGELFHRFWIPALLSEELPGPDCEPVRLRLLGEDLLGFKDTDGRIAIVDAFCPHRGAPLFFGRNEECGLRCVYHGWKFDTAGNCVEMRNCTEGEILAVGSHPPGTDARWERGLHAWHSVLDAVVFGSRCVVRARRVSA